jgi:succinate-acetate transporter protein
MSADPTPLGLTGFSSIVLMISMYYVGILSNLLWLTSIGTIAGITLLLSSYHHLKIGNTIPGTTFGVYGSFWISVVLYNITSPTEAEFAEAMTYIRIPIAIFTLYAWIVSLYISKISFLIFTTLEIKILLFIIGYFTHKDIIMKTGGISGIICSILGFYAAASLMLKPFTNLPLGKPILYPKNLN